MAVVGLPLDVNNSVFSTNAYPFGRSYGMVGQSATDFSMRNNYAGELGGLNADFLAGGTMLQANTTNPNVPVNGQAQMMNGQKAGPQPAHWWLTWLIIFIIVAFVARRYAPDGENFALIKPNLINGVFLTLWIVLILALLKQVALRMKNIPGVSTLADLILSV